jgi:hypothetical protein
LPNSILAGRETATPEFHRDQQKQIFNGISRKVPANSSSGKRKNSSGHARRFMALALAFLGAHGIGV